jgi:hypothetical protein
MFDWSALMTPQNPEPEFVNLLGALESISSLTGRYDNPICRTGPPWQVESNPRYRFLVSLKFTNTGSGHLAYTFMIHILSTSRTYISTFSVCFVSISVSISVRLI